MSGRSWEAIAQVLLVTAVLLAAAFAGSLAERLAALGRSFLRGRRPGRWSREKARGQLYRLAARATRGNDEEAARFLERAALGLRVGGAVVSEGALASIAGTSFNPELAAPQGATSTRTARDFRREDVAELRRRQLGDDARALSTAPTLPVFRRGRLVGYLVRHHAQQDQEGSVLAFGNGAILTKRKTWETDAGDHLLAELPSTAFRIAVLAFFLAVAGWTLPAQAAGRTYHAEALAWVAAEPPGSAEVPTHLRIEGEVAYVHGEADEDVHVRVCHNKRCMVAECVPGMEVANAVRLIPGPRGGPTGAEGRSGSGACLALRPGQRVAVWGISRYDGAPGHGEQAEAAAGRRGHWEIHPVEGVEVLP